MKIIEVQKFENLLELKDNWNSLLTSSNNSIFSTWEWISIWWKHFSVNKKLLILLAQENNKLNGIAPLMYQSKKFFGSRHGVIEFIGAEQLHTAYNDFIISNQHQKCIKMFFEHLNNLPENWIYAKLTDIPQNTKSLFPIYNLSKRFEISHECLTVRLPNSFPIFLKTIQPRARKTFNSKFRRLNENFKVELVDYSNPNLVTEGMKKLFELHQKRWQLKGGFKGMFSDPKFKKFSLEVAEAFSKKGWLGLYALELSGKTAAITYGFRYNSKYYANISGLDSEFLNFDIGILLRFLIMEKCIKDGFIEFDFLWGIDSWKKKFKPKLKYTYNSIVLRESLSAKIIEFFYKKYLSGTIVTDRQLRKIGVKYKSK